MPQIDKLVMPTVAARFGLMTDVQAYAEGAKLLRQLADTIRAMQDRGPVTDLADTHALCNRDTTLSPYGHPDR